MGALAERGRTAPVVLFSFVWTTLVYCVLTHWVWATGGWAFKWGVMDYAGGGPVEIGSGVGGLAYAFVLGNRKEDQLVNFRCVRLLHAFIHCITHLCVYPGDAYSPRYFSRADHTTSRSSVSERSCFGSAGLGSMPDQLLEPTFVPYTPHGIRTSWLPR